MNEIVDGRHVCDRVAGQEEVCEVVMLDILIARVGEVVVTQPQLGEVRKPG